MANAHQAPIKTCHWIKAPNYSVLMTGSDDKTLKFWDLRQQKPVLTLSLPEKCVTADVQFPYAVVSLADYGKTLVFKLDETGPRLHKEMEHYLKGREEKRKCISIFKDHNGAANGFAVGTSKSNAVVQYFSQIPRLKVCNKFKLMSSKSLDWILIQMCILFRRPILIFYVIECKFLTNHPKKRTFMQSTT